MSDITDILSKDAQHGCPQIDWDRQLKTAVHFMDKFQAGYKTQILADEVGMGKTYVALAAMTHHIFQNNKNNRKVLLVTPPSRILQAKWEGEIRSFDQKYIKRRTDSSKRLKPILLNNYWDLLENLHDYENQEISKFSGILFQCFVQALFLWYKRKTKKWGSWAVLNGVNEYSPDYLEFCSTYSQHALHSYFDLHFQKMIDISKQLASNGQCEQPLKIMFREFAAAQDTNEANVYVIGMNLLRKPRIDAWQAKRLNTYYMSLLLKRCRQASRETVLEYLENNGVLLERQPHERRNSYFEWVHDLGSRNIFGLREPVEKAILKQELSDEWNVIYSQILSNTCPSNEAKAFFKHLSDEVAKNKLMAANIGFCVIDEIHNWKNGGNGAEEFKVHYAPYVDIKLLMSATPFQIDADELRNVFQFVDSGGNLCSQAIDRIYGNDRLIQTCLESSHSFLQSWKALSPDEAGFLEVQLPHITPSEEVQNKLQELIANPLSAEALKTFAEKACDYRKALDKLQNELSCFIVRHTKGRKQRDYHIGKNYRTANLSPGSPPRNSLYSVTGFVSPSSSDSFLNFMAIRLDQKLRQNIKGGFETNAHLLGGITSSRAAFLESNDKIANLKSTDDSSREYQKLFMAMLQAYDHPKVAATVSRAYNNYVNGKKTLIFCERVATLKEIEETLKRRIDKNLETQQHAPQSIRQNILRKHAFVDNFWWRSFLWAQDDASRDGWIGKTAKVIPLIKKRLLDESAAGLLSMSSREITQRIDFHFFKELTPSSDKSAKWLNAVELFKTLGEANLMVGSQEIDEPEVEAERSEKIEDLVDSYLDLKNIWFGEDGTSQCFHASLWQLIESEAETLVTTYKHTDEVFSRSIYFGRLLVDLMKGFRKIIFREDLLVRYFDNIQNQTVEDALYFGFHKNIRGGKPASYQLYLYVKALAESNGSILMGETTKRRGLWQGMFRKETSPVAILHGDVDPDTRIRACAAFNSPLSPDILICTAIGSEGIDLHRQCAEVIHHDLPWNPARLEQRIGRVDRVGALAEVVPNTFIQVGIPFLEHNYEKYQYELVWSRAQKFEIILGKPDFYADDQDEEDLDSIEDKIAEEARALQKKEKTDLMEVTITHHLPDSLLEYLRIDLRIR